MNEITFYAADAIEDNFQIDVRKCISVFSYELAKKIIIKFQIEEF